MEKEFLERCLAKGMSLPQIGELTGRPAGTVGYWVAKHGLEANGKQKFSPGRSSSESDRESLERMLEAGMTLAEIGVVRGTAPGTVARRIQKYGLRGTKATRRTALVRAARASGAKEVVLECPVHGRTEFWVGKHSVRCKKCNTAAVAERRRRVKATLVNEAGGCCRRCGFDESHAALEFHHLDPATKSFAVSAKGVTRSIDSLRAEAQKCVLLCANCHAMVEAGVADVPLG